MVAICNAGTLAVETRDVRILGFWLACGVALVVGYVWGDADVAVMALVVAVGAGGVAAARASSALYGGRAPLVVAALAALLGRGAWAGNDDSGLWPGPRGHAAGVRELEIEGASHPGPRCHALARSGGVAVWLDAPPEACPLASGQRIRVRADRIRLRVAPELPGDPSPVAHARSQGAVAVVTVERVWAAGGEASPYWAWVAAQRQRAWEVTRGDPDASFVVAAGLGVRSTLSPAQCEALRRAGLGHLIAVSGLNVGLAAWAMLALLLRLGARVGGSSLGVVLSWVPLVGYVLLAGTSPPAVRAGIMAVGVSLGGLLGRPHHGPVLLVATSVVMLVVRPAWAFDPGFQLSVAAMATLVRAPAGEGIVRQTWRVTWVVLPLSLWHFDHAGAWGVVSNLVAVPLFTLWVLPLCLLGWWLVPWLGPLALAPAGWGARPILELAAFVARWPSPPSWAVAVAAGVALAVGLVVSRRGPHGELHARWGWLPPPSVAAAVVLVVAWPRASDAPRAKWWAAGSPRAPALVTVAHDGERAVACVHAVSLSPDRFRGLLDALDLSTAGLVARAEPWAPHELALQRTLTAQRRWVDEPVGCPAPPPAAEVAEAVALCRRRAGAQYGMALVDAEGLHCFVGGRWLGLGPRWRSAWTGRRKPRPPVLLDSDPFAEEP
jgi:ComEC/Rec2-related protein